MTSEFWDRLYKSRARVWNGRVNVRLAEIARTLTPGRALDLGCGEGGDAVWLAERGWSVVATDVSEVALQRARADAQEHGVLDRIEFVHRDLSHGAPAGAFDLVSAHFLHAPQELSLDRTTLLRDAADRVAPGGLLIIVDHGSAPPWSGHQDHYFPSAAEVLAALDLDVTVWERVRVESIERAVTGPEGQQAAILDNVILLRNAAAPVGDG
ncbi:SAM-dependent methyltransferase [Mycobacterium asiaticum]|nr:class I SAM-dependent methyltransferase [Mycobacterium asiaticum]